MSSVKECVQCPPQTLVLEHLVLPGDPVWEVTEPLGVGDLLMYLHHRGQSQKTIAWSFSFLLLAGAIGEAAASYDCQRSN